MCVFRLRCWTFSNKGMVCLPWKPFEWTWVGPARRSAPPKYCTCWISNTGPYILRLRLGFNQRIVSVSEFVGGQPSLDLLWFGTGPEVSALRLASFFSIFDCQEFSELYGEIDNSLLAALCLVTYIALQVMLTFYDLIYFSTKLSKNKEVSRVMFDVSIAEAWKH